MSALKLIVVLTLLAYQSSASVVLDPTYLPFDVLNELATVRNWNVRDGLGSAKPLNPSGFGHRLLSFDTNPIENRFQFSARYGMPALLRTLKKDTAFKGYYLTFEKRQVTYCI